MRASDLIGQIAHQPGGTALGRVADILVRVEPDGTHTVYAVLVGDRRRFRLFGYERPEITGPWPITQLARTLQGPLREIALEDIVLPDRTEPGNTGSVSDG